MLPDDAADRLRDGRSRLFTSQEVMDSLPEAPKDDFFGGSVGASSGYPYQSRPSLKVAKWSTWRSPMKPKGIGIAVISYHSTKDLRLSFQSFNASDVSVPVKLTVSLVDCGEIELKDTLQLIRAFHLEDVSTVVPYRGLNVGYGHASNDTATLWDEEPTLRTYAFFNADTELRPGVLEGCDALLWSRPDYGVVGPRQVDRQGLITHAGIRPRPPSCFQDPRPGPPVHRDPGRLLERDGFGLLHPGTTVVGADQLFHVPGGHALCPGCLPGDPSLLRGQFFPPRRGSRSQGRLRRQAHHGPSAGRCYPCQWVGTDDNPEVPAHLRSGLCCSWVCGCVAAVGTPSKIFSDDGSRSTSEH